MAVVIPREGLKIATLLKHRLSAPIARYRCQAKYFNGQPDGKIEFCTNPITPTPKYHKAKIRRPPWQRIVSSPNAPPIT
jgi:hypothetical protein